MINDFPRRPRWSKWRVLLWVGCVATAHSVSADLLNDGVTPGIFGNPNIDTPSPGTLLLAIFDAAAEGSSPNAGKTLLVNTHWSYADLVNGGALPPVDLSANPDFQAISDDPLIYNVVGGYAIYQNPETGKANLDKNGVELPFDDEVPHNAAWGVVTTGHAASDFSTDVAQIYNTLGSGIQSYWNTVNSALAEVGATETDGPDTVLVAPGDAADWNANWGPTLAASGLALSDDATAIHSLDSPAKVFWITNPSLDPERANTIIELGSVRLASHGRLSYTVAGGGDNHPPLVTITAPTSVNTGTTVILDGSASSDPDPDDTLSYAWTQTGGPSTVELAGATTATARFLTTQPGQYSFNLTVTDSQGATASQGVEVAVTAPINHAPTVSITAPSTPVNAGARVTLDGRASTDRDSGDTLSYRWDWVSGPVAPVLSDADTATASFQAGAAGEYLFALTVTDNHGASSTAQIRITVAANHAPVARVEVQPRLAVGSTVMLDGSGSADPDGGTLRYRWRLVSAPAAVTLDSAETVAASFVAARAGMYVFALTVTDNQGASDLTQVTLKVGAGVVLNTPTTWLVGRAQALAATGFQVGNRARVKLRFAVAEGKRFTNIGQISLKTGNFLWRPKKRHITRAGILQACLEITKPETCDQATNIIVKRVPK